MRILSGANGADDITPAHLITIGGWGYFPMLRYES